MIDYRDERKTIELGDLKAFRFLLRYAKGYSKTLAFGIFLLFISTLLTMFSSYLLGVIIDKGVISGNTKLALTYAAYLIGLEALAVILVYRGRKLLVHASSYIILQIREKMFEHIKLLPMSFYDKSPQGRVVTRLTHDVEGLDEFFSSSLGRFGTSFLLAVVAWIAILITDFQLGFIVSLSVLPVFIITYLSRNKIRSLNWEMSKRNAVINAQLSEFIQGLNVIRAFGMEKSSQDIFDEKVISHLKASKAMNKFYTMVRPTTSFLVQVPLLILIFYGGGLVLGGAISLGLLVTYIRYTERFTSPIETISREIHVLQQAFTSADRVAQFLMAATELQTLKQNPDAKNFIQGRLTFENVTMWYNENQTILKDVSFDIESGEKIGFLGRTGSGKTTTLSLIARLYPYQKGQILIDGTPIEDWSVDDLRAQIGFVSQDVFLFRGSLRDNLILGRDISDEKIMEAAHLTSLSDLISTKKEGLDFEVLEQGNNLSVGERQLVSFTRTLLQDPKVLILDEATSNIDATVEEALQKAMDVLAKGRTTIIIAHRLHTLRDCDRLIVFKDGQIHASGDHETLLKNSPYYKELYGFSGDQTYNTL